MDGDFDIDSIAKNLEINQNVLDYLHERIQHPDIFQYFTNVTRQSAFWNLIDESLPTGISLELHSIEVSFPCTDRDFPPDTLTPYFQDFYSADKIQKSGEFNFSCPYAFTKFSYEQIEEILNSINGWKKNKSKKWTLYDSEFSKESLEMMCNSCISETKPYLFVDDDEVREAYLNCQKTINKIDKSYDTSNVCAALRSFSVKTGDDFAKLVKGMAVSKNNLPKFNLSDSVIDGLSDLMFAVRNYFESRSDLPKVQKSEKWIESRAVNLDKQMELPFEKRYAFVETSQILQARSGLLVDKPFVNYSVAELLFGNNNGDVMPLPYINGNAEIQSGSSVPFCHAAFRKFVSRQLIERGYTTTTDSVIDILADFTQIYIKKVAQDAAAIKKDSSTAATRDILFQALSNNQSDIVTNPHLK
ncbi:hypothetical protein M9Y10_001719 [Tritrichomonas musculus]|uniref:Uncharacterized protein n=1 Tax=Tritrichomonas musculus TaxID=1915356 RepID=A0ABR2L8M4_9EUKA